MDTCFIIVSCLEHWIYAVIFQSTLAGGVLVPSTIISVRYIRTWTHDALLHWHYAPVFDSSLVGCVSCILFYSYYDNRRIFENPDILPMDIWL